MNQMSKKEYLNESSMVWSLQVRGEEEESSMLNDVPVKSNESLSLRNKIHLCVCVCVWKSSSNLSFPSTADPKIIIIIINKERKKPSTYTVYIYTILQYSTKKGDGIFRVIASITPNVLLTCV